ncbi:MAG: N-(5'-phosphoribosyl)anthranilate isomerase [Syntrophus sp. SKADARSKE-3]|nr:N-(5'-phosphoribosyl)anthranilate isomerase [Syntrophus sp. SKADARSKE-3]
MAGAGIIVQIYEVQEAREAEALVALGVDHIGSVILSMEAWKFPAIRDTVRAIQGAGAKSGLIPLFGDKAAIFRLLDYYQPDFIHFCEILSPFTSDEAATLNQCDIHLALQRAVKESYPAVAVMRSLSVPRPGMASARGIMDRIIALAQRLAPLSDFFLIDTLRGSAADSKEQPVSGFVGITGEICDWDIAAGVVAESPIPVILAGGIGADNVYDALRKVLPAGVDSCTRTNAVDDKGRPIRFRKDIEKVRRMVAEVRRAEAQPVERRER